MLSICFNIVSEIYVLTLNFVKACKKVLHNVRFCDIIKMYKYTQIFNKNGLNNELGENL